MCQAYDSSLLCVWIIPLGFIKVQTKCIMHNAQYWFIPNKMHVLVLRREKVAGHFVSLATFFGFIMEIVGR